MQKRVFCVLPVYNDWESLEILLENLEKSQEAYSNEYLFSAVIVNDGSTEEMTILKTNIEHRILNLKTNVGHQRAIAIGLQYVFNETEKIECVVVMDSDGEDKPEHIIHLLEKAKTEDFNKIIFAQRKKRQESSLFKTGYFFYKKLFNFLTGQKISFGNFCVIPKDLLTSVVYLDNIWNHFSGGIIQSKIPFDKVLLDRGKRYKGSSKMNFYSLTLHGLSSIAVYFDYLSLKILKYSFYGIIASIISICYILLKKFFTDTAIPGWASSLILIISGIILQLFSVTLIVLLLQLSYRKNINKPTSKVYLNFIRDVQKFN
ncbi:glycosyltransferase [Seonamhaeicola sp. ML3]|uniref:glycosyltransferase n=1 Tax=Seonamhaeicola sp. ML3 TaxID=2937786 RepID=UPI00200E0590|nr:glycosyltransferase [Seonamhaeicola sp. ML3]